MQLARQSNKYSCGLLRCWALPYPWAAATSSLVPRPERAAVDACNLHHSPWQLNVLKSSWTLNRSIRSPHVIRARRCHFLYLLLNTPMLEAARFTVSPLSFCFLTPCLKRSDLNHSNMKLPRDAVFCLTGSLCSASAP